MALKIVEKHTVATRWFHWINFPVLGVMIWSGLLIYWANDIYFIGWGDTRILRFFPDGFYKFLHASQHLADGMALHFAFMWLFMANGILYVAYTVISGEWRHIVPGKNGLRDAWKFFLHETYLNRKEPLPAFGRYSAAQQVAYTAIIVMGIFSVLTGIAIYKPVQYQWLMQCFGGYEWARLIHFYLAVGYCIFFLIHIAQVVRTGWSNFAGMVRGFEIEDDQNTSA
jgi:thiosulfate reductase cytochrome b subunit